MGLDMKIALCSDIHLEFGELPIDNRENADVLILSGDICVATGFLEKSTRAFNLKFFKDCSEKFPNVIYIMGNHEHYGGDFQITKDIIEEELEEFKNIHFLEKSSVDLGG